MARRLLAADLARRAGRRADAGCEGRGRRGAVLAGESEPAEPDPQARARGPDATLRVPGRARDLGLLAARDRRSAAGHARRVARRDAVVGRRLELRRAPGRLALVLPRDLGPDDGARR